MLYSHLPYHNDTINKQTHAMIKTQEDFFNKIFTSHFICKGTKGYSKFACGRELETEHNWNILTPTLWPSALCLSRPPGLLNNGLESTLLGAGFPYYISSNSVSISTQLSSNQLSSFCSIRRPYITFKLPRGDMDTPPRLRNSSDIWRSGCVTSAIFGMACVIVIKRK